MSLALPIQATMYDFTSTGCHGHGPFSAKFRHFVIVHLGALKQTNLLI